MNDHEGMLLAARTKRYAETLNPSLAEAIAVKEALSWAKDFQPKTVTLESDCLVIVQLVRSSTPMRSRIGQVIEECLRLVGDANNSRLYFVKRYANVAAHELARVSHVYPDRDFDWGSVPVKTKACILQDLKE